MKTPAIEVLGFSLSYPDGRKALRNISLSVFKGESTALLGPNGAGKSTLLLALVGVLKGSGIIRVAGMTLEQSNLTEIRRKAQLVFQDPNDQLFEPVVRNDVAFGPLNFGFPRDEVPALVAETLRSVGLEGFEDRDTFKMSFGERKRAQLAAAIACKPEILLLDEVNAGLDPRGKRLFADLLNKLQCTKLLATHDLAFAADVCQNAVVMDNGAIIATGPMNEVLDDFDLLVRSGLAYDAKYR